jgi:hypothetical protein
MQFSVIARGCEDVAVAVITADRLVDAVEMLVPKFGRAPDSVKFAETSARISFDDFVQWDEVTEVMDCGDVKGDIPMTYIVRPLPVVPYAKTGRYSD